MLGPLSPDYITVPPSPGIYDVDLDVSELWCEVMDSTGEATAVAMFDQVTAYDCYRTDAGHGRFTEHEVTSIAHELVGVEVTAPDGSVTYMPRAEVLRVAGFRFIASCEMAADDAFN